jgi:NADH-quinone oxidoreductase subunit L
MGGLRKALPLAFWSFMIGSAALSALPFTSGFYSKHEILLAAYAASPALWAAGCLGAAITGLYSFRLVFVAFFGAARASTAGVGYASRTISDIHDTTTAREKVRDAYPTDWRMSAPLLALCVLALFGAMLRIPLDSVFPTAVAGMAHSGFDPVAAVTIAAPFIGVSIAALFYLTGTYSVQRLGTYAGIERVQRFWYNGWGFDWLYDALVVRPFKALSSANKNDALDDAYTGLAMLSRGMHRILCISQTGRVRWYAASMGTGVAMLLAIGLLS